MQVILMHKESGISKSYVILCCAKAKKLHAFVKHQGHFLSS